MRPSGPACVLVLLLATQVEAHRLDEYLQATTLSVEKDRIEAHINLVPGVAVFPIVLSAIDTDDDGVISDAEQLGYADRVLHDLSLSVDGKRLPLRLISAAFPETAALQQGRGEIQLQFDAQVPRSGFNRRLTFENRHQSRIGAYLVNSLVPGDPDIGITAQTRNYEQSLYRLDYTDASASPALLSSTSWSDWWAWLGSAAIVLAAGLALPGLFARRRVLVEKEPKNCDHRLDQKYGGSPCGTK